MHWAGIKHQGLRGRGVPPRAEGKDIDINLAALLVQGLDPEPELCQCTTCLWWPGRPD